MHAIPDIEAPRIQPLIAALKNAPKNIPAIAHKIITITDTIVLNLFIGQSPFKF